MKILSELKYDRDGLIAAVIQDYTNNEILMVGYMNTEAIKETLTTGRVCFLEPFPSETLDKGERLQGIHRRLSLSLSIVTAMPCS